MPAEPACVTAIPLGRRLPGASSNLPGRQGLDMTPRPFRARALSSLSPPLFGLAPGGVCRAADVAAGAVRSYRTVSPLPPPPTTGGGRRSVLCGTIPGLAPAGCYPAPLVHGARTFLPADPSGPPERPSGRLTNRGMGTLAAAVKRRGARSRGRARKWFSPGRARRANPARSRVSIHRRRHRRVAGENGAGRLPPRRA